jgi:hypothetical protein
MEQICTVKHLVFDANTLFFPEARQENFHGSSFIRKKTPKKKTLTSPTYAPGSTHKQKNQEHQKQEKKSA